MFGFSKKELCSVCGKELSSIKKVKDGFVCKCCYDKYDLKRKIKKMSLSTISEVKEIINIQEEFAREIKECSVAMISGIKTNKTYDKFMVKNINKVFKSSDILEVAKSEVSDSKEIRSLDVIITMKDIKYPLIKIPVAKPILGSKVDKNSLLSTLNTDIANRIIADVKILMFHAKDNKVSDESSNKCFCTDCGCEVLNSKNFCGNCGNKLN